MSTIDYNEVPAMRSHPKVIFFTDFDGTITTADSNDYMVCLFSVSQHHRPA